MKIEFLLFGVATAFSDCKGPRKHFKIGKLATVQCSHEKKSCDINCEFGVKVCRFFSPHFCNFFRSLMGSYSVLLRSISRKLIQSLFFCFFGHESCRTIQTISGKLIHANFSKRRSHAICMDEFTRNQFSS